MINDLAELEIEDRGGTPGGNAEAREERPNVHCHSSAGPGALQVGQTQKNL
jgi:hypothetical protein